jgi:hypothetical protein
MGWIDTLPGALSAVSHPVVIAIASILTVIEFLATLIPGVASVWETIHTAIRPPAAAALAVLTAWHGDPALIAAAALLGGGLGFATHATKLGLRYTIDTSPEPVTNGVANVAELSAVATIAYTVWHHPYITLAVALLVLVLLVLLVRRSGERHDAPSAESARRRQPRRPAGPNEFGWARKLPLETRPQRKPSEAGRQHARERVAIDPREITVEASVGGRPHVPAWMRDAVLDRSAIALASVAPVVLGDELLFAVCLERARPSDRVRAQPRPFRTGSPRILTREGATLAVRNECVSHRQRTVRFVV